MEELLMTGEYWAELENNHHYIIVDSEHDRTYYCPAEEASNTLSRILNDKNKTIRRLHGELRQFKQGIRPVYEISRYLEEDRTCHVAFVDSEELAHEFCDKHKDCEYSQISMTKYLNALEFARANIPTCENCKHFLNPETYHSINLWCSLHEDNISLDGYCSEWEFNE